MRRALISTFFAAVLTVAFGVVTPAQAAKVHGAVIIDGAKPVEDGRYLSPKNYDRTMRFFRRLYGRTQGVVISAIKTTPRVKGMHIANFRKKRTWDGINVYQVGDKVFIYVLKSEPTGPKKK